MDKYQKNNYHIITHRQKPSDFDLFLNVFNNEILCIYQVSMLFPKSLSHLEIKRYVTFAYVNFKVSSQLQIYWIAYILICSWNRILIEGNYYAWYQMREYGVLKRSVKTESFISASNPNDPEVFRLYAYMIVLQLEPCYSHD